MYAQRIERTIKKEQTEYKSECSINKTINYLLKSVNNVLSTICDSDLKGQ